jgi:hypothetical protein
MQVRVWVIFSREKRDGSHIGLAFFDQLRKYVFPPAASRLPSI